MTERKNDTQKHRKSKGEAAVRGCAQRSGARHTTRKDNTMTKETKKIVMGVLETPEFRRSAEQLRKVEQVIDGESRLQAKTVSAFDYVNKFGELLYRVTREAWRGPKGQQRKRFTTCHPEGIRMEYGCGLNPSVPYRLPDVIAAAIRQEPIFICDGEKDADVMRDLTGKCATCSLGGLGLWMPSFSKYFVGSPCVVIVVHDCEVRKHFASDARHKLRRGGYRGNIKFAVLPSGVHEYFDPFGGDPGQARVDFLSTLRDAGVPL